MSEDGLHVFSVGDFGFSDPGDGDGLLSVTIDTLPSSGDGVLELGGVAVTAGQQIAATAIANGDLSFVPVGDVNGTGLGSFTFTVHDDGGTANGGSDTDASANTIAFNITSVNDAPVGVDDGPVDVDENTPVSGNVLSNDGDLEGDDLFVSGFVVAGDASAYMPGDEAQIAGVGSFTLAANGDYVLSPAHGYAGPLPVITYTLSDGSLTDTADLTFNDVANVNDAPVAIANLYPTGLDTPVSGNVVSDDTGGGSDYDPDGDALSVASGFVGTFATTNGGSITLAADGSFTYTPASGFRGADSFAYQITDGFLTASSTVNFMVDVTNEAPVATINAYQGNEDVAINGNAITDDTGAGADLDPEGAPLGLAGASTGTFATTQGGSITLAEDGTFTYTPPTGFNGTDSYTYTLTDGALTSVAQLVFTLDPVNDAPVAIDNAYQVTEDTPYSGNAIADDSGFGQDHDPDGDMVALAAVSTGTFTTTQGGTITMLADGSFTYTPPPNFVGVDTFDYTITDGGLTSSATLSFTIAPVNDAPVAIANLYSTPLDTVVTGNAITDDTGSGIDFDVDGDLLSLDGASTGTFATAQGGTITLGSDGSFTYTPAFGFAGIDSFVVTIFDGALTASAPLTFLVDTLNNAPTAVDNAYVLDENTSASGNLVTDDTGAGTDSDPEGSPLTLAQASVGSFATANGGTITLAADGSFVYVPLNGFAGADSYTYTLTDGELTATAVASFTVNPVNSAPVAILNAYTTSEDVAVSGNAISDDTGGGADYDPEGTGLELDAASIGTFATANGGSITLAQDGTFTYTPAANWSGTDTFDYQITDGALSATSRLSFAVAPVNDAPVASDNQYALDEDNTLTGNLVTDDTGAGIDSDVDGPAANLTVHASSIGEHQTTQGGIITLAADGAFTYTPDANFSGTDTYTYTVTDGQDTTNATATFTVNPVNDAPVGSDATLVLSEDGLHVFSVGDFGFSDPGDGDGLLSVTIDTLPSSGDGVLELGGVAVTAGQQIAATAIANGDLSFVPVGDVNGTGLGSFTFTVHDDGGTANGGSDTDASANTIAFNITSVNDAPVGVDDGPVDVDENTPVSGNVLSNDGDLEGDDLFVSGFVVAGDASAYMPGDEAQIAGVGSFTLAANGDYVLSPAHGYAGPLPVITYTLSDGSLTDTADLTFNDVANVNDAPVAIANLYPTGLDTPVSGNVVSDDTGGGSDYDPDGDALSVASGFVGTFATTNGGSITLAADGSFTYTPASGFRGADSFAYQITDGFLTASSTVNFMVDVTNEAPVATINAYQGNEDVAINGNAITDDTGAGADLDPEGAPLGLAGASTGTFATTQGGSITLAEDGTFTYTPPTGFNGTDSYTYTLTDGALTSVAQLVFTLDPVNDAPVAIDNAYQVTEDTPYSGNAIADDSGFGQDHDPDGDMVALAAVSTGTFTTTQGGTITMLADGSFTYTPPPNFVGVDTFDYTITDGGLTSSATLSFTIAPVNDAPVAIANLYSTPLDTVVTGNAITDDTGSGIDFDVDGDLLSLDGASTGTFATAQGGTITLGSDGSFTYTPAFGFAGIDSFVVTIFDGALTASAPLTFLVDTLNNAPTAVDNAYVLDENTSASGNLVTDDTGAGTDSDPEGSPLTLAQASVGSFATANGGTITLAADGSFVYVPLNGFAGADSYTYTLTDGELTATAVASFTVNPVNSAPVAILNAYTTSEDVAVSGNAISDDTGGGADYDPEGTGLELDAASIGTFATANGGSITLAQDGTFTYTPAANWSGTDTFDYQITDGALSATSRLSFAVAPVNDAPVASDNQYALDEDNTLTGNLVTDDTGAGIDSDVDGPAANLTVHASSIGEHQTTQGGIITLAADGAFTYTPDANFSGTDTYTYTVTDGQDTTNATATFTVNPVNDAPHVIDPGTGNPPADPNNIIPDVVAEDGDTPATLDTSAYFDDVDNVIGTEVKFSATNLPSGLSIDPDSGLITGALASDASQNGDDPALNPGVYTVTVTATDPDGLSADTSLTYTVSNVPPIAADDIATFGEATTIHSYVQMDNGNGPDRDGNNDNDPLFVSAVNGLASNVGIELDGTNGGTFVVAADGSFSFDTGWDFYYLALGESVTSSITYQLSDGQGGFDEATINMTVVGGNATPIAVDPSQPAIDVNNPPDGIFYDPDNAFMPPADPTNYIPVLAVADAETINPVDLNQYFGDPDASDTVSLSVAASDLPSGLTFDAATGILSGTLANDASAGGNSGTYTVSVTATDNHGASFTTNLEITVTNPEPVAIGSISDIDSQPGVAVEVETGFNFDDPDNDTLTYSVAGLPQGLTIDPASGLISGTVDSNAVGDAPDGNGTYQVTVTATDAQGAQAFQSFQISVVEPFVAILTDQQAPTTITRETGVLEYVPVNPVILEFLEQLAADQGAASAIEGELLEPAIDTADLSRGMEIVLDTAAGETRLQTIVHNGQLFLYISSKEHQQDWAIDNSEPGSGNWASLNNGSLFSVQPNEQGIVDVSVVNPDAGVRIDLKLRPDNGQFEVTQESLRANNLSANRARL